MLSQRLDRLHTRKHPKPQASKVYSRLKYQRAKKRTIPCPHRTLWFTIRIFQRLGRNGKLSQLPAFLGQDRLGSWIGQNIIHIEPRLGNRIENIFLGQLPRVIPNRDGHFRCVRQHFLDTNHGNQHVLQLLSALQAGDSWDHVGC